jgi:hypothetical protein
MVCVYSAEHDECSTHAYNLKQERTPMKTFAVIIEDGVRAAYSTNFTQESADFSLCSPDH